MPKDPVRAARQAQQRKEGRPWYEKQKAVQRRRYHERVAAGLCTFCGDAPAGEGRKTCGTCKTLNNMARRKWWHANRGKGNGAE